METGHKGAHTSLVFKKDRFISPGRGSSTCATTIEGMFCKKRRSSSTPLSGGVSNIFSVCFVCCNTFTSKFKLVRWSASLFCFSRGCSKCFVWVHAYHDHCDSRFDWKQSTPALCSVVHKWRGIIHSGIRLGREAIEVDVCSHTCWMMPLPMKMWPLPAASSTNSPRVAFFSRSA